MTSRSIGEILGRLAPAKQHRTGQPVRRDSYYVSDRRSSALWQPLAANNADARRLIALRLQAAEHFDRQNKEPGKWNGPLGAIGIEVLRELYRIVDYKTGRLDPAIATICERIRRSKQAVVDALKRLKRHGFLDWVRRSEPTNREGAGPQVRQISNAYGLRLPATAAEWVKKKLGKGPAPGCELARGEADAAEVEAMLATARLDEQIDYLVADQGLAEIFKRMAPSIRESSASLPNEKKPDSGISIGGVCR